MGNGQQWLADHPNWLVVKSDSHHRLIRNRITRQLLLQKRIQTCQQSLKQLITQRKLLSNSFIPQLYSYCQRDNNTLILVEYKTSSLPSQIPQEQVQQVFEQCLTGLKSIVSLTPEAFQLQPSMIGFDYSKKLKIWFHQDWTQMHPQFPTGRQFGRQAILVHKLISILNTRCKGSQLAKFSVSDNGLLTLGRVLGMTRNKQQKRDLSVRGSVAKSESHLEWRPQQAVVIVKESAQVPNRIKRIRRGH